jgi:hypothetical protein
MLGRRPKIFERSLADPESLIDHLWQDCSRFGSVLKAYQGHSQESIKSLGVRTIRTETASVRSEKIGIGEPLRPLVDLPIR